VIVLRSALFFLVQSVLTVVFSIIALCTFPFSSHTRYRVITTWSRWMVVLAGLLCGVRYRVEGAEHLPATPAIVLAKHQSAWETLALQVLLPPQVWVLKRELLRIPFFGWGLAMMNPIAIDRSAGLRALKHMLVQGRDRIARGFWIVMFPEGTRVPPGRRGQYFVGGAWLATQTGVPVVPVAHNAGTLWPKGAFLKYPGTIVVSIGPTIDPRGMKADKLNEQVETWIEAEVARLGSARS
jgi:1-acyl-sn-glycerol-3-phosphate acyltransferase